jgi:hypothetical protein
MPAFNPDTPQRRPDKEKPGYIKIGLIVLPLLSVLLLFFALMQMNLGGNGWLDIFKLVILSGAAYLASYLIYRMAIEKGAKLASLNYKMAGVLSMASILVVGISFFLATMPGLILPSVEERRLQSYVSSIVEYVGARSAQARRDAELGATTNSIADDLAAKAECEKKSSCISLHTAGGYGSTARTLDTLAGRAKTILTETEKGLTAQTVAFASLDDLVSHLETTLGDETVSIWDRRAQLRKAMGDLDPVLSTLDEALPVTTLQGYVRELQSGITIPNRPTVTTTINTILEGHANTLSGVLESLQTSEEIVRPAFPSRAGVPEAMAHALTFAPVTLITFTVDVLFPALLWFYTYWILLMHVPSSDPNMVRARKTSDFDITTEIRPYDLRPSSNLDPKPSPSGGKRGSKGGRDHV